MRHAPLHEGAGDLLLLRHDWQLISNGEFLHARCALAADITVVCMAERGFPLLEERRVINACTVNSSKLRTYTILDDR